MFSQSMNLDDIKSLVAIQGKDWLDGNILKINGFNVENTSWMSSIYKTLDAGHVDYFPRSIIEANTEFKQLNNDNLAIEQNILLNYPLAIYFFVHKDNTDLAQSIETGLRKAKADGTFDKLLFEHPDHKEALATANLAKRTLYSIPNPLLPSTVPQDPELWIDINKL